MGKNENLRDHPRACGEQDLLAAGEKVVVGSPPRVRGTAVQGLPDPIRERITPARAGNRWHHYQELCGDGDHPRACGEQIAQGDKDWAEKGSPPRVRGTDFYDI